MDILTLNALSPGDEVGIWGYRDQGITKVKARTKTTITTEDGRIFNADTGQERGKSRFTQRSQLTSPAFVRGMGVKNTLHHIDNIPEAVVAEIYALLERAGLITFP